MVQASPTETRADYPEWVEEMRLAFRSGTTSQFILHGNVHDLVRWPDEVSPERVRYTAIDAFLQEVIFRQFQVVLVYDRGQGLVVARGTPHWKGFAESRTAFLGANKASVHRLPTDPDSALQLVDAFIHYVCSRRGETRLRVAVVMLYADYVLPAAAPATLAGPMAANMVRVMRWASDPSILGSYVASVLVADTLGELADDVVDNPHTVKIEVPLPSQDELHDYLDALRNDIPNLDRLLEVSPEALSARSVGLSRVNLRNMLARASVGHTRITGEHISATRKRLIEAECAGLITFVETRRTLDDVAGHEAAKAWLRQDAALLRAGHARSLPMGYLLCGRVGTGKTYLATCWAGEIGVPCVVLKNFRDKWQGSTEGNLQKIFGILHALGQVMVFVDEADQVAGQRGGESSDNGVSGRVYAMLAQEMARPENRGRILWVFATSRPDLLEVDLKRTGRLDVRIPLFPPQSDGERRSLFAALARKVGLELTPEEQPDLPAHFEVGGNEMEAMLVRAVRRRDLASLDATREVKPLAEHLRDVIEEFRPSAQRRRLELMDLLAALECTDGRFLPDDLRAVDQETLRARLDELRSAIRS